MQKFILFLTLSSLIVNNSIGQNVEAPNKTPFSIGDVLKIQSDILQEERVLNVYLPTYYQYDTLKNYQVLYLLDGSADEDFIHIAGLVQFATFPWVKMMPETIIVGIGNVDRKRDFSFPTLNEKDKVEFPTSGGSAKFIQYLKEEVQPLIERQYRTSNDKIILGQSLGGLLATEILFKAPDLFNKYMIVSPSLWWNDESLLEYTPNISRTTEIFVAVGKEGEVMERTAKSLVDKLNALNSTKVKTLFYFMEEHDHANILHLAAYKGFELLFEEKEESKH